MAEEWKLCRTWPSPYASRVVHTLKIKGLEYETVLEDLTKKSASLLVYNPVHKKVPILLHNGRPVCESLGVLEYIDEVWKQSPLLPQDPYEKAMAPAYTLTSPCTREILCRCCGYHPHHGHVID